MQRPFPNGNNRRFGCSGYVTAVAAGQSQRLYSGVGIFDWYYLSSPPQILRAPGVDLERRGLKCVTVSLTKRFRDGRFTSETATWTQGYLVLNNNVSLLAMAVGQRQRLYSGVRMFTGNYLSSTPRALRG
jgi:hypothetical protein